MDWNAQTGKELRTLDRIVAMLLALAGLAERAAGAPYPVRWLVLWFLRRAEAVVTDFVAGSACVAARGQWLLAPVTVRQGSSPADAIDLALSLSRLAFAVAAMVTQIRRQAFLHRGQSSGASLDRGPRQRVPGAFGMTVPQVARPDTS
jgi:hypothetical protein